MHYELNVDSLFFMNFIMNLYLLILVDRSTLRTAAPGRLAAGAAFGALGFLLPFVGAGPAAVRLATGILLGTAGMVCTAFRVRSLRMFLKLLERLAVYSFGMGGVLLFLIKKLDLKGNVLAGVLGALGAGSIGFVLLCRFRYGVNMKNALCRATLFQGGERAEVNALLDSGNSLVEPVSGKPVCVLDKSISEAMGISRCTAFRAIPYRSIGKRKGILPGYLLPGLELELEGMRLYFKDVYVAVSDRNMSADESEDAESVKMIVNPALLAGGRKGKPHRRQDKRKNDTENSVTGKDAV